MATSVFHAEIATAGHETLKNFQALSVGGRLMHGGVSMHVDVEGGKLGLDQDPDHLVVSLV